jgi:hypothetical protein
MSRDTEKSVENEAGSRLINQIRTARGEAASRRSTTKVSCP